MLICWVFFYFFFLSAFATLKVRVLTLEEEGAKAVCSFQCELSVSFSVSERRALQSKVKADDVLCQAHVFKAR